MQISDKMFLAFSYLSIICAVFVIISRNPIHSILFLILTFFNCAATLFVLNIDFLALLLVIVYVGAISILFLFVVMMLNIRIVLSNFNILRFLPVGLLLLYILHAQVETFLVLQFKKLKVISVQYTDIIDDYTYTNNVGVLGNLLFENHIDVFLLISITLLLSMVGSISLTMVNKNKYSKKQIVHRQLLRVATINLQR